VFELVDTHVHLDDARLSSNIGKILAYARSKGVTRLINIGHDMESSQASLHLAQTYNFIWAAVGIHPHSATELTDRFLAELEELAASPRVVAMGEIGLDYYYDHSPRQQQRDAFRVQLELAVKANLPVVIHQRDAVRDTLDILGRYSPLPRGGVMHCFSGSLEVLAECEKMNLHIGLGGPVTFTNARKAKEAAEAVSLDKLILETDCPYLTPHPHRGKTNQPGYLPLIAAEIAKIRSMEEGQLIAACSANAVALFGLE